MDSAKYDRSISMMCPTCGNTEFEYESSEGESPQAFRCPSCGRELSKAELIEENSENIDAHVEEMKDEIVKDLTKDLKKQFKDAFKGNKSFRIK